MSVAETFRKFRLNYLIPKDTLDNISYRYKRITKRLNNAFWENDSETQHSLFVGSFGRDTATRGVSDIDLSFQLPWSEYTRYNAYTSNGQTSLLQKVRREISETYPNSSIGADGQVVQITFSDNTRFEILPVFLNADQISFTYADSNNGGSWKTCNPRAEIKDFIIRNKYTANGNLKAICRMTRIWRDTHDVKISGILIDTLAYQWIISWPHKDKSFLYHDYLVRDFMLHLSEISSSQLYWRAPGSGSFVWRTSNFQLAAKHAHSLAVDAIDYQSRNMPYSATSKWREIFGSNFPSP